MTVLIYPFAMAFPFLGMSIVVLRSLSGMPSSFEPLERKAFSAFTLALVGQGRPFGHPNARTYVYEYTANIK